MYSPTQSQKPGSGAIELTCDASAQAVYTTLRYSYPLKLTATSRYFGERVACLYMLSYGGGLLSGDVIDVEIMVRDGSSLVLLTQGT